MGNVESTEHLTEEDLNFCKKNTRYTEEEIKTWYSSFKKDCPSGVLTKEKYLSTDLCVPLCKLLLLEQGQYCIFAKHHMKYTMEHQVES